MSDSPDDATTPTGSGPVDAVDLDAVEHDLNGVDTALGRLDDGSYWTDEVTGEEIPDEVLAENPAARRA